MADIFIKTTNTIRFFRDLRMVRRMCKRYQSTNSTNNDNSASNFVSCGSEDRVTKGVVIGVYDYVADPHLEPVKFTESGDKFNNVRTNGQLEKLIKISGPIPKVGESRLFYGLEPEFNAVAVVGLGPECAGYCDVEERDQGKESIRIAAAVGCQALQKLRIQRVYVESFGHTESAGEGASLGVWVYQELKNIAKQIYMPQLELFDDCDFTAWHIGLEKGSAQNLARQFMETPSNIMTPTTFAQSAVDVLCKSGINVEVKVQGWAETQKMGAFLSVAKGSCEPPIFLEISYYGASYDDRPIVLIGSGITFDSGGLCLKKPYEMRQMKGDVGGAACVLATIRAVAHLQLPLNIRGLIPLCENMPGCSAYKPGDIVTAMNGRNIRVDNTDCEGRLVLADALYYSQNFWPRFVVDVGTLTMDIRRAMGTSASGVFTNSDALWEQIRMAGVHTGDRMWRFPLWDYYTKQVSVSRSVDLKNVGVGPGGGACRAAAFLRHFVPCGEWLHIDMYGVMYSNGIDDPYLREGMTGRPTRTLIEFISQMMCKECK